MTRTAHLTTCPVLRRGARTPHRSEDTMPTTLTSRVREAAMIRLASELDRALVAECLRTSTLPRLARIRVAVDVLDELLAEIARHGVSFVEWPPEDDLDSARLVLPGGAVLDAAAHQVDEWTWVYVAQMDGADTAEISSRLCLAPPWWPRWRGRWYGARDYLRAARRLGPVPMVHAWVRSVRLLAAARLHQHLADRATDARWLVGAAVWSLSAVVGRFAPRTAQRLDRLACDLEDAEAE